MNKILLIIFLTLVVILSSISIKANPARLPEDAFIMERLNKASKPGAAVAVIRDGELVFTKGYGYSNLAKKELMTEDTPITVASISKIITTFAVMQLKENGQLLLDEDINQYLPFRVRNIYYPNKPITLRMLLTHTSGLEDNWIWVLFRVMREGDPHMDLGLFLKEYLVKGGQYFKRGNFVNFEPGAKFEYCGVDMALAAYIVENVSGMKFEDYCQAKIFKPLQMDNTSWFFRNLKKQPAMIYEKF